MSSSGKQKEISFRNDYVNDLKQFISSSKYQVKEALLSLDWCEDRTSFKENERELITCPLNEEHRVSIKNLTKHEESCAWHQQGYRDDDVPFLPAGPSTVGTVRIDKTLQEKIIADAAAKDPSFTIALPATGANVQTRGRPQTSDRWFSDFTTDERRALYDYVVAQTAGKLPELKEFSLPSQAEGKAEMTKEQLMAAERDAKRRRVKYRTAKVKGKNYAEVMREVINNQMQAYEDWLKEQEGVPCESPSRVEPEKKQTTIEPKTETEEMVWIECDRRVNPYLRWKYLLEKEKRKAEEKKHPKEHDNRNDERSKRKEREEDSRHKRKRERSHDDSRDRDKRRRYDVHPDRSSRKDKYENNRHKYDPKEYERSHEKDRSRRDSYSNNKRSGKEQSHSRHDLREKDSHKSYKDSHKGKDHDCNQQKDTKEKPRQKSDLHADDSSLTSALAKVKRELADNTEVDFNNGNTVDQIKLLYEHFVVGQEKNKESNSEKESSRAPKHKKKHRKTKKSKKHKSKKKKKTSGKHSSTDSSDSSAGDSDCK